MAPENNYIDSPNKRETWFIILFLFVIYNLIKISYIQYSLSDENVYFYMGKLVSEGIYPYRDFFFAHPPLKLIPPAIIFFFMGFNFTVLKLIPVIATDITAILLFLIVKNISGNFHGIFTTILFLFSFSGLYYTSYFMGTNLTTTFIVTALYLYYRKSYFISGLLLGLALLTGLYSICALIAIGLYLLLLDNQALKKIIFGFLITFLSVNCICILFFGERYYIPVYFFHFLKSADITNPKSGILLAMAKLNIFILCLALLYPFFRHKKFNLIFWIAISYIIFLIGFASIHDYYFILSAPFLAIVGGHSFLSLLERLKMSNIALVLSALIIFIPFAVRDFDKASSSISLSSIPQASEIAKKIKESMTPNDTIFGQAEITPLIALLSDTRIYNNQVDTSEKPYITGVVTLDNVIDDINKGKLRLFIGKEKQIDSSTSIFYGPMVDKRFREFIWADCKPILIYNNILDPNCRIIIFGKNTEVAKQNKREE